MNGVLGEFQAGSLLLCHLGDGIVNGEIFIGDGDSQSGILGRR